MNNELKISRLEQLLERILLYVDDLNAEYGNKDNLCILCHSTTYNGIGGIIHFTDCVLLRTRIDYIGLLSEK